MQASKMQTVAICLVLLTLPALQLVAAGRELKQAVTTSAVGAGGAASGAAAPGLNGGPGVATTVAVSNKATPAPSPPATSGWTFPLLSSWGWGAHPTDPTPSAAPAAPAGGTAASSAAALGGKGAGGAVTTAAVGAGGAAAGAAVPGAATTVAVGANGAAASAATPGHTATTTAAGK